MRRLSLPIMIIIRTIDPTRLPFPIHIMNEEQNYVWPTSTFSSIMHPYQQTTEHVPQDLVRAGYTVGMAGVRKVVVPTVIAEIEDQNMPMFTSWMPDYDDALQMPAGVGSFYILSCTISPYIRIRGPVARPSDETLFYPNVSFIRGG